MSDPMFFVSERDDLLKDAYLWALVASYGPDMLLVWTTAAKRSRFDELVDQGLLPGRKTDKRPGRSRLMGDVERTLVLSELDPATCRSIVEKRDELFTLFPMIYQRVGTAAWSESWGPYGDEK